MANIAQKDAGSDRAAEEKDTGVVNSDMSNLSMNKFPAQILFVFVASIASGYTADLIGCDMKWVLENNLWVKHIMGLFTLVFFIVLADEKTTQRLYLTIAQCVLLYLWFMMLTRTPLWMTLFIMAILFTVYILDIKIEREEADKKKVSDYEKASLGLKWISMAMTVIGFAVYFVQKYREFGSDFNVKDFVLGTLQCAHDDSKGKSAKPKSKRNNKAFVFR